MTIHRQVLTVVVAAILAIPTASFAQTERGAISGIVTDETKAAVPGVSIKVINTGTNVTDDCRLVRIGGVQRRQPAAGHLSARGHSGRFPEGSIVEGIVLTAGATTRIDVSLNLGAMTETVNVVAENTTLQTEDAKVATTVSNRLIDELPLVVGGAMRSPFDLISTVAEAKTGGGIGATAVSLGGGQGGAFGATLDGVSVNTNRQADITETAFLTPSLEAITEFAVETNGFKPEFGQAGGGGITFASKSGTNTLKGSTYGFFRHDALDTKGFFEQTKGIYEQSDFGGSLGGPVVLGKLYNGRNRTFFFASYEGFYNQQGSNAAFRSVPTPEMWNGDFSNWVDSQGRRITIYDPATTRPNPSGAGFIRDPFPNNMIPAERFSTVARQYIALARSVLVPNRQGIVPGTFGYVNNNYVSEDRSTIEKTNKYSVKIDHTLSARHRVAYLFNRTSNGTEPGPNGATGLPDAVQRHSADHVRRRPSPGELGLGRRAHRESPDGRREHVQQELVLAQRRSELAGPGLHSELRRLQPEHGRDPVHRALDVGRRVVQRHRAAEVHDQGRPDLHQGLAHDQGRLHLRSPAGQRLRPAGHRRQGSIQLPSDGRSGCHELRQRRRQFVRLVPARVCQRRANRDDSLPAADLPVLRVLCAGRLAAQQASWCINYGVRYEFTRPAGRRRRPVLGTSIQQSRTRR